MPDAWTVDAIGADYGLDVRVEIFSGGNSTGFAFYVQLKATDSDLPPRVRVKSTHLDYWHSLDEPVALALWQAGSDQIYWRWVHHHHPFVVRALGSTAPDLSRRKTETIKFSDADLWNPALPWEIEVELKYLRKVRSGSLSLPLDVGISRGTFRPISIKEFDEKVSAIGDRVHGVHIHSGVEVPGRPHFFMGAEYLQMQLGRLGLSVMRARSSDKDFDPALEFPALLGIGLCTTGSTTAGIALIERHGLDAEALRVWSNPRSPFLPMALERARRPDLAVTLVERWLAEKADGIEPALVLLAYLMVKQSELPPDIRTRLDYLVGSLDQETLAIIRRFPPHAASTLLNAGRYGQAADIFDSIVAGVGGAAHATRDVLFDAARADLGAGRYRSALAKLERIVDVEPTSDARWNKAQALQKLGRYSDARDTLLTICDPTYAGRVRLAVSCLSLVILALGPEPQIRESDVSDRLSRAVRPGTPIDQILDTFNGAFHADAIARNTWRLQVMAALSPERDKSLGCYALCAMAYFDLDDPEWHATAVADALHHSEPDLMLLAIEAAVELFGSEFAPTLRAFAGPPEKFIDFVEAIRELKQQGLALTIVGPEELPEAWDASLIPITGTSEFTPTLLTDTTPASD